MTTAIMIYGLIVVLNILSMALAISPRRLMAKAVKKQERQEERLAAIETRLSRLENAPLLGGLQQGVNSANAFYPGQMRKWDAP